MAEPSQSLVRVLKQLWQLKPGHLFKQAISACERALRQLCFEFQPCKWYSEVKYQVYC